MQFADVCVGIRATLASFRCALSCLRELLLDVASLVEDVALQSMYIAGSLVLLCMLDDHNLKWQVLAEAYASVWIGHCSPDTDTLWCIQSHTLAYCLLLISYCHFGIQACNPPEPRCFEVSSASISIVVLVLDD